MRPAWVEDRLSVSASVSLSTTALATVISRPSRIQATPRAITMRVWKGDHGKRSIRAGIRLRITPGDCASRVVIERLRAGLWGFETDDACSRPEPHQPPERSRLPA